MLSLSIIGLTAVGLSGDAFAASVARGAMARENTLASALRNGAVFGSTEGIMCLIGWFLAVELSDLVSLFDHWVALLLLSLIGGKMIFESFKNNDEIEPAQPRKQTLRMTFLIAFGTSIDASVVGGALSLSGASALSALIVGLASATFSTAGFLIGPAAGRFIGKQAEMAGGLILITIGLSIWVDHMFLSA